jgi:hypothetical protein
MAATPLRHGVGAARSGWIGDASFHRDQWLRRIRPSWFRQRFATLFDLLQRERSSR